MSAQSDLQLRENLRRMLMPTLLVAFGGGALMFGSLSVWASRAPLASAAIASGTVSPDSSRKVIQHLEGGILREINVAEGSTVKKGQVLFTLEPIIARAQVSAKRQQWIRLQVTRARLEAHSMEAATFDPPAFPKFPIDENLKAFIATQVSLFYARRKAYLEREDIYRQQIEQLKQQVAAKTRESESLLKQRAFLEEEIADKKELIAKSLARKPEWLALERARADVIGRIEANTAELSRIDERTREIELSIVTNRTTFQQEVSDQLVRTNSDISQIEETLPASEDILRRTDIVSPADGTVLNLRFKTIGGVLRPGEPIVDLVPADDALYIDAKLSPNDIDVVHAGLPAEVYLTPYVSRHAPRLVGTVTRVGADITRDQSAANGAAAPSYFEIRVRLDEHEYRRAGSPPMTPGMPAEVYVLTGTRTFAQYFTDPIVKSFRRAFRED